MTDDRCPNCRARKFSTGEKCRNCGWMPLRPTELLFVEDQQIVCPQCSTKRSSEVMACPQCGNSQILEAPSENTSNFHLSSMFLLTTLVAICVALARISLALGIPAFAVLSLSAFRTALLIKERKRYRYPVAPNDMWDFFGRSLVGIIAGGFVFVLTCVVGGSIMEPLLGPFMFGSSRGMLIAVGVLLLATHAVSGVLVCRYPKNWMNLLLGGAVALSIGVIVLPFVRSAEWLVSLPVVTLSLGALILACQRGGGRKVKAFVVGHSLAISSLGLVLDPNLEYAVCFFAFLGLMLLPILFSVMTLELIWSWDDAFPRAISHPRSTPIAPTRSLGVVRIED